MRKSLKMPKSQIFGQFPPNENILFAKIPSFVIFVINHQKSNSQLNFYFFNFTYESLCSLFFFICLGHRFFKIIARGLGICGTNQKQRIFISDDNMLVLSSLSLSLSLSLRIIMFKRKGGLKGVLNNVKNCKIGKVAHP